MSGAWHQRRQDTITTSSSDEQISVGETRVEQTLTRVRSDTSPVGASLQEMYGLVSKNRDNNEKVSKTNRVSLSDDISNYNIQGISLN